MNTIKYEAHSSMLLQEYNIILLVIVHVFRRFSASYPKPRREFEL